MFGYFESVLVRRPLKILRRPTYGSGLPFRRHVDTNGLMKSGYATAKTQKIYEKSSLSDLELALSPSVQDTCVRALGCLDEMTNPPVSDYLIQGATGLWKMVVGLEIHAQILSKTKLFSSAPSVFGDLPNHNVALFDAFIPGTLPVLNEECVDQAIKIGLAIDGNIRPRCHFDRKHYFYCDLPGGYQITQHDCPIVTGGYLDILLPDQTSKRVSIEQIQLETDSGKSLHDQEDQSTYVDLNRSGCALVEIVCKPEINSPLEAAVFFKKLQLVLKYLDVCNGNMQEGSLRCDANVSVQRVSSSTKGTRCEIKNLNSIRNLSRAIEYEAHRQVSLIEADQSVGQETRFYNPIERITCAGREKGDSSNYLFFPEPDLLYLTIDQERIRRISDQIPLLPDQVRDHLINAYNLDPYDANVLSSHLGAPAYFERVARGRDNHKDIANWIINDIFSQLKIHKIDIAHCPVSSDSLGEILDLISDNTISSKIAKDIIMSIFLGDTRSPSLIVRDRQLTLINDHQFLQQLCIETLSAFPNQIQQYHSGNARVLQHFVGHVMRQTDGKAPGKTVTQIFLRLLRSQPPR